MSESNEKISLESQFDLKALVIDHVKGIYNKKSRIFVYQFDRVQYLSDTSKVLIEGWGFSSLDKSPLDYFFGSQQVYSGQIKRFKRKDINKRFNLEGDYGFEILLDCACPLEQLWCVLETRDGEVDYPVQVFSKKKFYSDIYHQFRGTPETVSLGDAINRVRLHMKLRSLDDYSCWIFENEKDDPQMIQGEIEAFAQKPVISIAVPVYNVEEKWLRRFIDSVKNQYYPHWELCLADDCSPSPHVRRIIDEYVAADKRIKVTYREANGHISEATNTAIKMATGDFLAFMDNDDELAPNALFENAKAINADPEIDFLYSDEDKMDIHGRRFDAFFKPDWNPELLLGHNYITHFVVVKKSLQEQAGLLRTEMNGAQDYDFVLRATEKAKRIHHIPKILYHWRTIEGSTAANPEAKLYAYEAGEKSLDEAMKRRGLDGAKAMMSEHFGLYHINYRWDADQEERPSIAVVLTGNPQDEELDFTLNLITEKTVYPDYHFVVLESYTEGVINPLARFEDFDPMDKKSVNELIRSLDDDYILFWDGKTVPVHGDWLAQSLNLLRKSNVGVVGAKVIGEKRVLSAGISISPRDELFHVHQGYLNSDLGYYFRLVLAQNVFAVGMNGMMVDTRFFKALNGFDKKMTSSDEMAVDLCMRSREAGYAVVFNPEVVLRSQDESGYEFKRLSSHFKRKHSGDDRIDPYFNSNCHQYLLRK